VNDGGGGGVGLESQNIPCTLKTLL